MKDKKLVTKNLLLDARANMKKASDAKKKLTEKLMKIQKKVKWSKKLDAIWDNEISYK